MILIKDLCDGARAKLQVILNNVTKQTKLDGSAYLNMEVKDASGSINAKKWEIYGDDEEVFVTGNVVEITAEVSKFKEALQLKVIEGRLLQEYEIEKARFIKASPIPKEEIVNRFNKMVSTVIDEDCSKILNHFINKYKDILYDAPAAVSVHHEFSSGLILHSVSIAELCDEISYKYNDINRDLLVTGALLHDFGKLIELEATPVYKYSIEGKLLGHISIMCAEIRNAAKELQINEEVAVLLEHMILSHHGQMEFGSPVLPLTREALILSIVDSLDSKMLILDKAYEGVEPGGVTQKIYPLDGRTFYKSKL